MTFINDTGWTGLDLPAIQAMLAARFPDHTDEVYLTKRETASYMDIWAASLKDPKGLRVENPTAWLFVDSGRLTMTNVLSETGEEESVVLNPLGRDADGIFLFAFPEIVVDEYGIATLAIVKITS